MAPESEGNTAESDDPERYVGLHSDDAQARARAQGWTTVRTLPPDAVITMEYLSGRLNFTVDEATGTVLRCWLG